MTGGELAAVVATMPEADQQAIRATVREILQERDQRSAGADRSKSATASGSPLTQDGSSGNGQQGAGLRSRALSNRRGKEPDGEGEQHEAAQGTDC